MERVGSSVSKAGQLLFAGAGDDSRRASPLVLHAAGVALAGSRHGKAPIRVLVPRSSGLLGQRDDAASSGRLHPAFFSVFQAGLCDAEGAPRRQEC